MKPSSSLLPFVLLSAALAMTAAGQMSGELESRQAEPGLAYGNAPANFALPKTILFSVSPDEIIADAEEWQRHGINAFFLDDVARDWSSDIWSTDGEPWTIGASDKTFQ